MQTLLHGLRYSIRMLLRSRGVTVVAVITIALCISSIIFSVVNASTSIPINPTSWTELGPAPYLNGDTPGNTPEERMVSGRVTDIAPHPTNPNIIYIAVASGGVWKTTNGGASWTPQTDFEITLFMGAIAISKSNPNVIYAGTGEANNGPSKEFLQRTNIYYGQGVLKSTDGGDTWTLLRKSLDIFFRRTISRIIIDPTDPDRVYVAVGSQAANGLTGNNGIWRSLDGGLNWENTTTTVIGSDDVPFSDMVIDPDNCLHLYAAAGDPFGAAQNGLYETVDGGDSWIRVASFLDDGTPQEVDPTTIGRIALAIDTSNGDVLYAAIMNTGVDPEGDVNLFRMQRTNNGGTTWTKLTSCDPKDEGTPLGHWEGCVPNYVNRRGDYNTALAVDPNVPNIVYAAGKFLTVLPDLHTLLGQIVRSLNGGEDWEDITIGHGGTGPHADHHALVFDAAGVLLDGNDGGIFGLLNPRGGIFGDNAREWLNLNTNLGTGQLNGIALDPTNPDRAYGGSQDNDFQTFDDALAWFNSEAGDDGSPVVSHANLNMVFHSTPIFSGALFIFRVSSDQGEHFTSVVKGIDVSDPQAMNFYQPIAIDTSIVPPGQDDRLLFGTNLIYQIFIPPNLSPIEYDILQLIGLLEWKAISPVLDPNNTVDPSGTGNIDSLVISISDPSTIYASAGGKIFVTFNGLDPNPDWDERNIPGFSADTDNYPNLTVDPTNNLIAYAVRDRFTEGVPGGHVFRTTDGGLNWKDISISASLPNLPTYSLAIDTSNNTLFVGNDTGVFASNNLGESWFRFGAGLPNVQVVDLELNTALNILAAGTFGRGMWQIALVGGGGNNCSIAGPVHVGTSAANILILLIPAFAIGLRMLRRMTRKK